ncbi:MAG TPA: YncE family protein [Gemmataceae bacterium]|nr:YncE family protein [Gemmataceae bacterium]
MHSRISPSWRIPALLFLALSFLTVDCPRLAADEPGAGDRHLLYVAAPGIRDYLQFGGAGILVFDMDHGHRFVKRISTPASQLAKPENIKGVCASAATGRLYFTTLTKLYCLDLSTEKVLWDKALTGGCDRLAITPDGKLLYVPSLEGAHWHVVDAGSGAIVAKIEPNSGAHNTICSLDGSRVYLAGLRSRLLSVVDTRTQKIVQTVGPFDGPIRPFTVSAAQTLCFVTVNDLLGFEVGDLKSGKMLHRVEVEHFRKGTPKRHGCPSHGVGLNPDETEIWVCDGANSHLHVFDATITPPRQMASLKLREQPGWVTFSLDGRYAYPSTGEVVDTASKKILLGLADEQAREVHSEKMVEIVWRGDKVVKTGDQFGVGRAKSTAGPGGAKK